MAAGCGVVVLFESEGVHLHGGATAIGRAAQDSVARAVVDVELCVVGACVPTDEVIQQVVAQRRGGAAVGAAGDIAPGVVAAAIDQGGLGGAGGAITVDAGQFVRLGVAVQVLLLRTGATHWPLPELAQMGIDEGVGVVGPA